jgi:hypothetical protein
MIIQSSGFGFEIEFLAKCKKIGARIYEVPISYYGRTYEEGKKIRSRDGLDALWYLVKFNILIHLKQSFRSEFLEPTPKDIDKSRSSNVCLLSRKFLELIVYRK